MSLWRLRKRAIAAAETAGSCKPGCIHLEPHTLDECATHEEFMAMCHAPPTRPCKYDGEPITYDPSENVWTRRGLHEYGRHDGPCGRKLVLLRLTPGTPPWRAIVPPPGGQRE